MMNPTAKSIYIFYGFSGDPGKAPAFPNGKDNDKSLGLVAETLKDTLSYLFPGDKIYAIQAWSKNIIIDSLAKASKKIRQVHVVCHGDSTMLSLAYEFDQKNRLRTRAKKYNLMAGTARDRTMKAMRDEDALVAGFLSKAMNQTQLEKIKANHSEKAGWQIWGCYCGYASDSFSGIGDAVIDPYLKRFNMGKLSLPGIAVEIAKTLGVTCTAAKGGGGINFWHGEKGKKILLNNTKTKAKKPFWLWNTKGSTWVTYDARGKALPKPLIFQVARNKSDLPTPKPPTWLTQAGVVAAGLGIGLAKKFRAPLGKTIVNFFESDQREIVNNKELNDSYAIEPNTTIPLPPDYVHLRSAWGAKKVGTAGIIHTPEFITIHHTATPNNANYPVEERIRDIQNYHIDTKKWQDIGYHFLISSDGEVWQGRENMERTGAHVAQHNKNNIGIAFIGNYQKTAVPQVMLKSAAKLLKWLANKYDIALARAAIKGHREWMATICPGDYLMASLPELISAATRQSVPSKNANAHHDIAVGAETFSTASTTNDPYLSLISSFSEDNFDPDGGEALWDKKSPSLRENTSDETEGEPTNLIEKEKTEELSVEPPPLTDDEIAHEMSDVFATLGFSENNDDDDDFKEKLRQAALGQYKKEGAEGHEKAATSPAAEAETAEAKQVSHDIFDHLVNDLSHATTFDLGKHEINQRLDSFAQEVMTEEERPKLPLAAERTMAKASELNDLDLVASLALIEDSRSKKENNSVLETMRPEEKTKIENIPEQRKKEPSTAEKDIPIIEKQQDEENNIIDQQASESGEPGNETKLQEAT